MPIASPASVPVLGFAGWSGSGKTTLIEQLLPCLVQRKLKIALIKHAHHDFDIDHEGKDSWRHRKAGASQVLVSSQRRWALMHELDGADEPSLNEHLARLGPCDLVIVEGYKQEPIPKIEIHRPALGNPLLASSDPHIIAVASDEKLDCPVPRFDLNKPLMIADFIVEILAL